MAVVSKYVSPNASQNSTGRISVTKFPQKATRQNLRLQQRRTFFAACPAFSVIVLKPWHERRCARFTHLDQIRFIYQSDKSSQTFSGTCCRQMSGCAHVRRCPDWQCWRDSAFWIEKPREKGQRKNKKEEKRSKKKSKQTHAERLAPWGPKAGHGNWPRVGATSLSFFLLKHAILYTVAVITAFIKSFCNDFVSTWKPSLSPVKSNKMTMWSRREKKNKLLSQEKRKL